MQANPVQCLRLDLEISVPYSVVLDGLDAWFEWGLISEVDFKWRNGRSSANRLTIVAFQNDQILQGLDLLLELGLITQKSVKLIAETRFVCEIKTKVAEPMISRLTSNNFEDSETTLQPANISGSRLPRSRVVEIPAKAKAPQEPSKVAQTVRSLLSEFSTMWLLFLGVFLVVVSSGLLAASQWDNFSPQIQYLLLLAYTLGFFGVGFWTSKNERLRMTTRALQLVTLLLVPANFWAMDGLGLLKNPAGIGLSAIAGCILSAIAVFLLETSFVFREAQILSEDSLTNSSTNPSTNKPRKRPKRQLSQISILAILLLGWLHLGWFLSPYYPLISVYLGIIAIATSTLLNRRQSLNTADSSTFPLALITGAYSTVLLISRALLFGNVSIFKLGLAFGVCGWVLVQITNKSEKLRSPSEASSLTTSNPSAITFQSNLGQILLGLGWLLSVWDKYPWQTFTISLLIAWMLCDRLVKSEESSDLTYLFFWGLQILWLVQRLIPDAWKGNFTQQLLTLFQTQAEINLLGILLFPYLIITLVIAAIYRDRQKYHLASTGELLALGFGVFLTIISVGYPSTIFVNLSLSAVTLFIIQARRLSTSKDLHSLVYFAHIVTLSAIFSGIYFFTRSTAIFAWVGFLFVTMLVEWSGVLVIGKLSPHPQPLSQGARGETPQIQVLSQRESPENILPPSPSGRGAGGEGNLHLQAWRDSAWHIGASLAALSYILLWSSSVAGRNLVGSNLVNNSEFLVASGYWGIAWLCVPLSLTFLGTWREFADRDLAIKLSIAGLAITQFLTWNGDGSRMIGLGVAYALMLVNTRRSKSLLTTFNTVGYGLVFIASLLWQFKFGDGYVAQLTFGINGAVVSVLLLYVLNHWLKYRRDRHVANLNLPLNQSYSQAFDIWAAILSTALLLLQTSQAALVFGFNQDAQLFVNLLPSTVLVTLGLVYRIWQDTGKSPFWTEWGIAWSVELLTSGAVVVSNGSAIELAIANIALGFVTQLCGDWWMKRSGKDEYPRSWDIIPLIYGVMGSLLRIGNFSSLTGLFSLSTSLIGIGIGRRSSQSNPVFKALTYLSMVVATFSAYELLFYQMVSNPQGRSLGDGLVILAVLGCAIAYAYRLFANWIAPYLRLSYREIGISAHLHWTASAIFLFLGSFLSLATTSGVLGGGVAIALAAYAITQGKISPLAPLVKGGKEDLGGSELWIYTGIATAIGAIAYFIFFAFPNPWLISNIILPYAAAIACIFAAILYQPPWEEWGWEERPWHNSAFTLPLIFTFMTQSAIAIPCLIMYHKVLMRFPASNF
jgi:uncharacterized membrane protein YeaQ/YmgE (transglycosylase-associated protein family)